MSQGFVYYPSAYYPLGYSALGMWVRYKKTSAYTNGVRIVDQDTGWVQIDCPDRELLVVRNLLNVDPPRPLDGKWDEYVPLSLTNSVASKFPMLDRYMVNYEVHNGKPHKDPRVRVPGSFIRDGKQAMSDSGGFQILSGKIDWIDPHEIGKWYSENVNEGITLDVPIFKVDDMDLTLRTARVQRENSKIIRSHVPEDFKLFNVAHGLDREAIRAFRGVLEEDEECGDYICVGGAYHGSLVSSLFRLVDFILDPEFKPYKQYHILGVYNVSFLSVFIRMAALLRKHHREDITLSSDASTQVYSAGNRTMHLQRAHYKNAERLFLGKAAPVYEQNPYRLLACQCHVCQTLKYTDIVSHVDDAIIAHTFIFHNMVEIQRWVHMMNHYAETLSDDDYRELVKNQLSGTPSQKTSLIALDMITAAITEGVAVAKKRFAPYLESMTSDSELLESMMEAGGFGGDVDLSHYQDGDWIKDVHIPKVKEVCDRYETFHNSGEAGGDGKKTPKSKLKRTAKKVMSNSTVAKAGSKRKGMKVKEKIDVTKGTHAKKK